MLIDEKSCSTATNSTENSNDDAIAMYLNESHYITVKNVIDMCENLDFLTVEVCLCSNINCCNAYCKNHRKQNF